MKLAVKEARRKSKEKLKRWATVFLATGGYAGFLPVAPGTFGSIVGVLIFWLFRDTSIVFQIILATFISGIGVIVSEEANRIFNEPDSGRIVIDEIAGMLITMIGIPATGYWIFWGFLLFRILDVVKLPPANIFDSKLKNGWGVMLDDVFAGLYGNIILHLMLRAQI